MPRSLAATWGISFDYSSSGYLDVSVRPVPSHTQWHGWLRITAAGLLHSDICGSKVICTSPQLFAACRVLHRQISPRHPPYALTILTYLVSSHLDLLGFKTFMVFWDFLRYVRKLISFDEMFFLSYSFFYTVFKEQTYLIRNMCFSWFGIRMVEMRRIELLTPCLQGRCSPSWATPP